MSNPDPQDTKTYHGRFKYGKNRPKVAPSIIPKESVAPNEDILLKRAQRFSNDDKKHQQREYGLVSRGEDNRLQKSESARKTYFEEIQKTFMEYCESKNKEVISKDIHEITKNDSAAKESSKSSTKSLDNIFMSLRKLREALLYLEPSNFSKSVYLFSIRIAADIGYYQTYVPSINYLLEICAPLLTQSETREISTLLILHLSHFNNSNSRAFRLFFQYASHDVKLLDILRSWIHGDYFHWKHYYEQETDIARASIMGFGLKKMTKHSIQCVGASYFRMKKGDLQQLIPVDYSILIKDYECDWKIINEEVIIRERAATKATGS